MSDYHTRRLEAIRDEFLAAHRAVSHVRRYWDADDVMASMMAAPEIKRGQIDRAAANIELTYFVQLFAGFEALMRDHLTGNHGIEAGAHRRVDWLITRVTQAENFRIDPALRTRILAVRDQRNEIAHGRANLAAITLNEALSFLSRLLARLPDPRR